MAAAGHTLFQSVAPTITMPQIATAVGQGTAPFTAAMPVLSVPAANGFDALPIAVGLWALGFASVVVLWLTRWMKVRAALAAAKPVEMPASIPVKMSPALLEPGLVGIFRPVLLLPEGITQRLSPPEMFSVLAHELCHLGRKDNLTAAIHMLVEALFWFHPLVWWLGARLVDERERACDESVVEAGTDPETYAHGILKVCQHYLHSPLACAAGVSGADLKKRMESITKNEAILNLNGARKLLLVGVAAATLALPIAAGISPAAMAQSAPSEDDVARMLADQNRLRTAIPYDAKNFDKFVGFYYLNPVAIFTISRNGDTLFSRLTGQPDLPIYPESETKFFAKLVAAQISFDVDSSGKVTGLVLHQAGREQAAKRIDEAAAKAIETSITTRYKNQAQSPDTEAALRRFVEADAIGEPDYADADPGLTTAMHQQAAVNMPIFKKLGAVKSVKFTGVGPAGADIYEVDYANGRAEWRIMPLWNGKIWFLNFHELP